MIIATVDIAATDQPAAELESERDALQAARGDGVPISPQAEQRSLAMLGAIMAVWPELTIALRLHVAGGVIAAMAEVDPA